MGSPLANLGAILHNKDAKTLSISTSIATLLNAICWAFYGCFDADADILIIVPNVIGVCLASIQLMLSWTFSGSVALQNKTQECEPLLRPEGHMPSHMETKWMGAGWVGIK
jgi:hypothetical protein